MSNMVSPFRPPIHSKFLLSTYTLFWMVSCMDCVCFGCSVCFYLLIIGVHNVGAFTGCNV